MRQTSKDITITFGATGCPPHTVTVPKGTRVSPISGEPTKMFVEDLSWLDRNSMAWHDANYYGIRLNITDTEERLK